MRAGVCSAPDLQVAHDDARLDDVSRRDLERDGRRVTLRYSRVSASSTGSSLTSGRLQRRQHVLEEVAPGTSRLQIPSLLVFRAKALITSGSRDAIGYELEKIRELLEKIGEGAGRKIVASTRATT